MRRLGVALLAWGLLASGCASTPPALLTQRPESEVSTLQGWEECAPTCGRSFASAYTVFVFQRVDDAVVGGTPTVRMVPGRHWVEAHYKWGVGVLTGIGNYRGYAFEHDFEPGHRYAITDVPSGCIVPAVRSWVSPKTLTLEDRSGSGATTVRDVAAMEYCSPSSSPGTCRSDADCRDEVCTIFPGRLGYGLCGASR